MRLNYSGVDEAAIREGVRRIGKVVREQIDLYSTLTGHPPPSPRAASPDSAAGPASQADVVELRRRAAGARRRA
jgi:2-aminoadipate transaminase